MAQILCGAIGTLEQQAAFATYYGRREARILNGNLSHIDYLRLSMECNEIVANTIYMESLIETLQQLRLQHKALGSPGQKDINWQVCSWFNVIK